MKLAKRHVGLWLQANDGDRLQVLADEAGLDLPKMIERLIGPFLANDDDLVVVPITLHRDVYERLLTDVEERLAAETDDERLELVENGIIESVDEDPDMAAEISGSIENALIYTRAVVGR